MLKNYVKTFEQFVSDKFAKVNEDSNQSIGNSELQSYIIDWNKTWGDKITFEQGKWNLELTDDTKKALTALANLLKKHTSIKFDIVGHTNSDAIAKDLGDGVTDNQKLSEKRAQAVKDFLVKNIPGIDTRITAVVGKGESELIDSNYNTVTDKAKEDKDKSRRVEIKVTGFVEDEAQPSSKPKENNVSDINKKYLVTIDPAIEDAKKRFDSLPKQDGKVKSQKDGSLLDLVTFSQRYVPGQNQVIKSDLAGKKYTQEQLNNYIKNYLSGNSTF